MTEDIQKALARAIKISDADAVAEFLADGAVASSEDISGTPLICAAAQRGEFDIAKQLLAAGANVNAADKDGATPLIIAALKGNTDLLALFIEAGAALDHQNKFDDETAVAAAAGNGHLEAVKLLIDAGADIHKGKDEYTSPLDMARFGHHGEVEEMLRVVLAAEQQRATVAERQARLRQIKKGLSL